ncbi:MFS transporter [Cohnella cholangitidis]|uniref:MFS transporter n=1 Tax=Cohnella cholangitidis TaxID=2598458 RepID=A0A7G5C560_9BACL|nr:MFS transporter [Cohnella cholangitidis]QMV44344.1 MFS transporter [Cohnella cholangitidis]
MKLCLQWPRPRTKFVSETSLSPEARVAIFIHGCFQFGASMSGLFLNLYLWRLTEDLAINGIFNLIVYGMTPIAFAIGGWIAKKKDRMVTYRLGIALITVFFLVVNFAQEKVVAYYPLFAVFNGLALGLYWTGYLVLMYDVTNARNRSKYLGINMIVFNSAGLAGPALSGFLISLFEGLRGYILTFAAASALFGVASFFSLRIKRIDSHHRTYYLKYSGLMMKKNRLWVLSLFGFLVLGLFQGLMLFLPNILMYQTVGREDQVGYMTVFFALLTIVTGYIISRKNQSTSIRRELFAASLLIVAGAAVLLFEISLWTVILFMSIYSLMAPWIINMLTSYYYRIMDGLPLRGMFRIESVVIKEFFLNVGRVLSILLQVIFASDVNSPALPIVLLLAALTQLGIMLLVRNKI